MMTVFRWDRSAGWAAADRLPESATEVAAGQVVWVDLSDPTPEEEAAVFGRFLKVHLLTLEDITKLRREPDQGAHFPKVEEFPDYLFVIVNPLPPDLVAPPEPGAGTTPRVRLKPSRLLRRNRPQLSAVITHTVLITHHYQPLGCLTATHNHLARHPEAASRGPDYIFHLVLDELVDDYAPVVDRVATRLDRLEVEVFRDPSPKVLGHMLRLKRMAIGLRKTLVLEREVLARLIRGEFKLVAPGEVAYYRNVFDHLVRYTELIDGAREMVSDLMQTHLAAVSNRLNEIMKVLAMISTVILPMTLISGIYGMNFKHMPELEWLYGYPMSIGLMVVTAIGAFSLFRWKKWL
jgi:magnesium transporter